MTQAHQPGSPPLNHQMEDAVISSPWQHACITQGGPLHLWSKSSAASNTSRSSSPVTTPSDSSNYYAASTSSFATSAGPANECGFPNDEDADRWDDEEGAPRNPANRPATPAGIRSLKGLPTRSPSKPSSLRNAISARQDGDSMSESQEREKDVSREAAESDTEESCADSDCETAGFSDDDEDEDEDNEWSGQNGNLESLVLEAAEGDYALAAYLVPMMHRDFNLNVKCKVETWRCTTYGNSDGTPEGSPSFGQTPRGGSGDQGSSGGSRKRRRINSDGDTREGWDGEDGEDREDDDSGGGKMGPPRAPPDPKEPLLACPFHKKDPRKYGIHGENAVGASKRPKFRACVGPGFRSIQRLKEHLKRVHSPVQCERCWQTFSAAGRDRSDALIMLGEHRKQKEPCALRDTSLKEGIDEAQWAVLDKQNRKKNQEVHRLEKWFEIWDVIFPGVGRPESPWNEVPEQYRNSPFSSQPRDGEEQFAHFFLRILDWKIQQRDIQLPDSALRERLKTVAQQAFRLYTSVRQNMSPDNTSSSGSHQNRSSHLSAPPTTASLQHTAATTAATSIASGMGQTRRASANSKVPGQNTSPTAASPGPGQGFISPAFGMSPTQQYMSGPTLAGHGVPAGAAMSSAAALHTNMQTFGGIGTPDPNPFYFDYSMPFPTHQGAWLQGNLQFPTHPQAAHAAHMAAAAGNFHHQLTMPGPEFAGFESGGSYGGVGDGEE